MLERCKGQWNTLAERGREWFFRLKNGEKRAVAGLIEVIVHILVWTTLFVIFAFVGYKTAKPYVVVSFYLNGIFFYCHMIMALHRRAFSLDLIHWFFMLAFMFFAPMLQYLNEVWCWDTYFSDSFVFATNILLALWSFLYVFIQGISLPKKKRPGASLYTDAPRRGKVVRFKVNKTFLLLAVFICDLLALILFAKNGTSLFSRSTNNSLTFSNQSLTLLVESFVPAAVTFVTVLALYNVFSDKRRISFILLILQLLAQMIICFPLGMARYKMAVVYIGLILIVLPFMRKGPWFLLMMFFGLIFVFPFVNAFRRQDFGSVDLLETMKNVLQSVLDAFMEGDYDAYTLFMLTQQYVMQKGITFGNQLLGVIFFFVPRSFWSAKPVGSGQMVAEYFRWNFTNLSCPLFSEGYVNFGVMGIILFAVAFGKLVKTGDQVFWDGKNEFFCSLYPFLVPFLFFFLRGDMLSSFAYSFGFSFSSWVIYMLNRFAFRIEKKVRGGRKIKNKFVRKFFSVLYGEQEKEIK